MATPVAQIDTVREWPADMAGQRVGWIAVWKRDGLVFVRFASAKVCTQGARWISVTYPGNEPFDQWDGLTDAVHYQTAWKLGKPFEIHLPQNFVDVSLNGQLINYFGDTPDDKIAWVNSPAELLATLREKLALCGASELFDRIYYNYNTLLAHPRFWRGRGLDSHDHALSMLLADPLSHGATLEQIELISGILDWIEEMTNCAEQVDKAIGLGWVKDGNYRTKRNKQVLLELADRARGTQIPLLVINDRPDEYRPQLLEHMLENARNALDAMRAIYEHEE
ncbi:hypothetical protein IPM09_02480 [Candidatus Saccharibacteria bacterium]|nr:MAG: hypothetical protein IPM09_02480 [Candidatus Saccharibacteria bacterium]